MLMESLVVIGALSGFGTIDRVHVTSDAHIVIAAVDWVSAETEAAGRALGLDAQRIGRRGQAFPPESRQHVSAALGDAAFVTRSEVVACDEERNLRTCRLSSVDVLVTAEILESDASVARVLTSWIVNTFELGPSITAEHAELLIERVNGNWQVTRVISRVIR